jgi:hypothetical protein
MNSISHIVLQALAEVSKFDIYDTRVIVQIVWSRSLEPTVLLLPIEEDPDTNDQPRRDWRIEVTVALSNNTVSKVTTDGLLGAIAPGSPKDRLGNAAFAASKILLYKGWLEMPVVISARAMSDGYSVAFGRLPLIAGGHMTVYLSNDLQEYRISAGR